MSNTDMASRLDWGNLLGFSNLRDQRDQIGPDGLNAKAGSKDGIKPTIAPLGAKIGGKLGIKPVIAPMSAKLGMKTGFKPT